VQRLAPCATEETRELTPQRAYNTPIQAGAGEVLLASLRILMEQLGEAGLTAKGVSPIAVIHDEIILEAPANLARLTGAVLESAMRDGMKELFPDAPVSGKFLEVSIGDSWADK
jgi:DNA polymerase I-like protein with 3'-5' exonuclease and polymerase domains